MRKRIAAISDRSSRMRRKGDAFSFFVGADPLFASALDFVWFLLFFVQVSLDPFPYTPYYKISAKDRFSNKVLIYYHIPSFFAII